MLSLAPAIIAVVLAIATRNVILSLFSAIAAAGIIHARALFAGLEHALGKHIVGAIADSDHAKTLLFTVLIGGMVGIVARSGGTRALVEALAKRARSRRSVQILAWLSGLLVFFDDYANCMIVGSSMGPLCDRHKVSRAKLAYIVDSTAAPVASLALVSTWVGFEVGVIAEGLKNAKQDIEPYSFFVQGWPYRFYPILAMVFVGMVASSGRDFGPMLNHRDEPKAGADEQQQAETGSAPWWVALLPILTLVGVTLYELWRTGSAKTAPGAPLFELLGNAAGYDAILHGALASVLLAMVLTLGSRALSLKTATKGLVDGMTLMFEALIILVLAWSLSAAMKELGAPAYLVGVVRNTMAPWLLPTVVFLVGAGISFAVGSSYTTMGIMMPIVVPVAFDMVGRAALDPSLAVDPSLPLMASGSVLAGACFGDHCSPISDTTVLSSIGSGADLLAHVRTQLPYALAMGAIAVVFGTLPAGLGLNAWVCLALGFVASGALLWLVGKKPDDGAASAAERGPGDGPSPDVAAETG